MSARLRTWMAGAISIVMVGAFTGVSTGSAVAAGCGYQNVPSTTTTVKAGRTTVPFGGRDKITTLVFSGAGAPPGNVFFKIDGVRKATVALTPVDAFDSMATWYLPKNLNAGKTYTVAAVYPGSCSFQRSVDRVGITVVRAQTTTSVAITNTPITRGMRPIAHVQVTSQTRKTVRGNVTVILKRGKTVVQKNTYSLVGGAVDVTLKPVWKKTTYRVIVRYHRRLNFTASHSSTSFTVN